MIDYLLDTLRDAKKPIVRLALAALIILMIAFLITLLLHPDASNILNSADAKKFGKQADSVDKFIQYVVNNGIKVPLQMFVFAFIPLPFLYFLPVAFTAALVGFTLYFPFSADLQGKLSFFEVMLGLLPHSLIEFAGFIIFSAVLYRLNILIRRNLFRRDVLKGQIGEQLKRCSIVYILSFSLLVIAAAIEAFITPLIG